MNELTLYFLIFLFAVRIIGLGSSIEFYFRTRKEVFKTLMLGWALFSVGGIFPLIADSIPTGILNDLLLLSNIVCASLGLTVVAMGALLYFTNVKLKLAVLLSIITIMMPLLLYAIIGLKIATTASNLLMYIIVTVGFIIPLLDWTSYKKKVGKSIAFHFVTLITIISWLPMSIFVASKGFPYGLYNVASSFNYYVFLNYFPAILGTIVVIIYLINLEYSISERDLRDSETRYRLIAENANDMISIVNQKLEVDYINEETTQRIMGYPIDELENLNVSSYIHPDDVKPVLEAFQNDFETGEGMAETRLKRKDGTHMWIESKGRTFIDREGEKKYLVISRDITERKAFEESKINYTKNLEREVEEKTKKLQDEAESLQQALKKLEATQEQLIQSEKLASIGLLAAGIAHEINNPLMGIINYSQIIREELNQKNLIDLQTKPFNFLEGIIKEGNRIAAIVQGLLSFAREDRGYSQPVDIANVINSSIELVNPKLKNNQIELQLNYDNTIPKILARSRNIQQVILNLLQNSIDALQEKYGSEPGAGVKKISIQTSLAEKQEKKYIKITITDNGLGIKEDELKKIFDPFFTTKQQTRERGVGLGLSVTYGIIKAHGGEINVKSKWQEYTTIDILLPISPIKSDSEQD